MSAIPYECSCPSNALPMEQWCVTCREVYAEAREDAPLCWKCRDTGAYRVIRRVDHGFVPVEKECACASKSVAFAYGEQMRGAKIGGATPAFAEPVSPLTTSLG